MTRGAAVLLAAALAALPAASLPFAVSAKDLGVRGATWPVAEPDLLEEIEARLLEMEQLGRAGAAGRRKPASARGGRWKSPRRCRASLPRGRNAAACSTSAITVARDIRTAGGVLIAAAGTRVNPLERTTLSRDLLFVDGRRDGGNRLGAGA